MFDPRRDLEWVADPMTLFQTDRFRSSEWVRQACDRAGGIFVTRNDEVSQHGHFATFFGILVLRDSYAKPVLHDLYVLHEVTHRATRSHEPGRSWMDWSRAFIGSELESSLASECFVYAHLPGLRAETFDHEIWVDRFLSMREEGREVHWISLEDWEDYVRTDRIRALNTPRYDDYLEHQIRNYGYQNVQWCRIWALPAVANPDPSVPAFRVVDAHMSRPDWRDRHVDWLEEQGRLSGGVPFPRQAEEFGAVYDQSVRMFGNRVLSS